MELTDAPAPKKAPAVNQAQSDQSGRSKTPPQPRPELLKLLGFSSFWLLVLVLALEIAVTWFALALAVALVSTDLPVATLWQRFQVLLSTRPTTLVFLFVLAAAIVVPTFIWFHVSFLWVRLLWRDWRTRASQAQRSAR